MNSLSISGKSWIFKQFNQEDLNFIKDNYSLDEITSKLLKGAVETLTQSGISNENIFITKVPGSFELIFEAKKKSKESKFDSIIVIGCLIKGDTKHFKYLCSSISYAIARINLKSLIYFFEALIKCSLNISEVDEV